MQLIVKVPVADLRNKPLHLLPRDFSHHPERLSQLLKNEKLHLIRQEGAWLFVEAIEQPCFKEKWGGYFGWVHIDEVEEIDSFTPQHVVVKPWIDNLSYGTYLENPISGSRPLNTPFSRETLLKEALFFIDSPYLWGGRGSYSEKLISGVDCSGIISLLYRAQGITVPRDAHDQSLKAKPISHAELEAGDLIFLRPTTKPRVTHVMIYYDKTSLLESPKTGEKVRLIPHFEVTGDTATIPGREPVYVVSYGSFV